MRVCFFVVVGWLALHSQTSDEIVACCWQPAAKIYRRMHQRNGSARTDSDRLTHHWIQARRGSRRRPPRHCAKAVFASYCSSVMIENFDNFRAKMPFHILTNVFIAARTTSPGKDIEFFILVPSQGMSRIVCKTATAPSACFLRQ